MPREEKIISKISFHANSRGRQDLALKIPFADDFKSKKGDLKCCLIIKNKTKQNKTMMLQSYIV